MRLNKSLLKIKQNDGLFLFCCQVPRFSTQIDLDRDNCLKKIFSSYQKRTKVHPRALSKPSCLKRFFLNSD